MGRISLWPVFTLGLALMMLTGCASSHHHDSTGGTVNVSETGMASYYADKYQGRPTASGERFDMNDLTAAHKTLPFGTRVRVTNLDNGKSVTVRINDRGPFVKGRVIDLSLAAAKRLDMVKAGVAPVKLRGAGDEGRAVASTN
jgi:rare lipoprotein A